MNTNVRIIAFDWRYLDVRWTSRGWQNNFQRFETHQLPQALALAASLRERIPVHHVTCHLFRGPIPSGRQLRLNDLPPATEQLNVNPFFYHVSRGYDYEAPTWAEVGIDVIDDMEGLIAELEGGLDPKYALIAYNTPEEIASAQATNLARNAR